VLNAEIRSVSAELLPGRSRERGGGAGLAAPSREGRSRELDDEKAVRVGVGVVATDDVETPDAVDAAESIRPI
jgi:hypothetical protein